MVVWSALMKKNIMKAKLLRSWAEFIIYDERSGKIENRFDIKIDGITYDKKFIFSEIGYNFEPSEIGAAFGLVQLGKLSDNIKKDQKILLNTINF